MIRKFVAYYRVSTAEQGRSGLGLEAQQETVRLYLRNGGWPPIAEFTEVESGRKATRPQLAAALKRCKLTGATLLVAKVDRLSRDVRFLLNLKHGCGHGGVVFCDMPNMAPGPMDEYFLTQMAAVAQLEAGLISQRTKAALAAAKVRGTKLGGWRGGPKSDGQVARDAIQTRTSEFASRVRPIAAELRAEGMSLRQIAAQLAALHVQTSRGGAWTAAAVNAVLKHPA